LHQFLRKILNKATTLNYGNEYTTTLFKFQFNIILHSLQGLPSEPFFQVFGDPTHAGS
jgi:hypothetical protein